MIELLVYYLIAINFIAFAAFGIDKARAENGQWRISEDTLVFLAFIGGLPGALAGRSAFRHKTRKGSFTQKLAAVGVAQLAMAALVAFLLDNGMGQGSRPLPGATLFESAEEEQARLVVERSVTYSGCNQVRALGRAPLYRGQPGYRDDMDGDGDGVACEARW